MKTITKALPAVGALLLVMAGSAWAQGPGGPGGFHPSPQMMQAFQAMRAWRTSHPNIMALQGTIRGLGPVASAPDTKLDPAQARRVLGIISAWRGKPALTDKQAAKVNGAILRCLSVRQKSALAQAGPMGGRRGMMRPGATMGHGPGAPGGMMHGPGGMMGHGAHPGGMMGHGPMMGKMPKPHDYNPLNPSTMPFPPMRSFAQQHMDALIATLKAEAK